MDKRAPLPEAPSIAQCEQDLLAAGFTHLHATPFWQAPGAGNLYAGPVLAWQMLKTGSYRLKCCKSCGQPLPDEDTNTPIASSEVTTIVTREVDKAMNYLTREAEREALKASTNKTR